MICFIPSRSVSDGGGNPLDSRQPERQAELAGKPQTGRQLPSDLLLPEAFNSSPAAKPFIPQLEKRPLGDESRHVGIPEAADSSPESKPQLAGL